MRRLTQEGVRRVSAYMICLLCGAIAPLLIRPRCGRAPASCSSVPLLAGRENSFHLINGELETGIRIVQESLRRARMRVDARIVALHTPFENRLDRFFSEGDKG